MQPIRGVIYEDSFFDDHVQLFSALQNQVRWDDRMKARKTASFGKAYDYSQITYEDAEIPPVLAPVRDRLVDRLGVPFNNCLLNLYESGDNTLGFHSDDISDLFDGSGVAIISLGTERTLTFRANKTNETIGYRLRAGSLLYMDAEVQSDWKHALKRQSGARTRISLTWRAVR